MPTTSGNFVSLPGGGGLNGLASTTVSMWVEWNGTQPAAMAGDSNTWGQYGCVLGRRQVSGSFDPQIGINGPNPSTCQGLRYGYSEWMDGNNTPNDLGSGWGMPQTPNSVSPGDGVWVNVVTTFDSSGDVTMYMNGVRLRSVLDQPLINDPDIPLTIGAYYGTDQQWGPSDSTVDDFGIFNTNIDGGVTNGVPNNTGLVAAIYNLGVSNLKFDLGDVSQLFTVYGNQTGTATVNGLNWTYATGLSGGLGVLQQSGGNDYVQLDSGGGGVEAPGLVAPRRCQRRRPRGHQRLDGCSEQLRRDGVRLVAGLHGRRSHGHGGHQRPDDRLDQLRLRRHFAGHQGGAGTVHH